MGCPSFRCALPNRVFQGQPSLARNERLLHGPLTPLDAAASNGHGIREDFTGPDPLRIEQHMADLPMPELCRQNEGSMTIFGTRAGQQLACVFSTPEGRCDGQINAGASAKQSVRCFEAILLRTPVYHGFCPRGPKILGEEAGRLPRIFKINPATLRSPLSRLPVGEVVLHVVPCGAIPR